MDLAQIGEMLGLASSAVGVTEKAVDTAQSIKGLFQSGKEPDKGEVSRLLNTLASELTSANMMNVELSTAIKSLSEELYRQDEFQKHQSRYELFRTKQDDMVFRLKDDQSNGEPEHFICPVCLNRDKIFSFVTGRGNFKVCQTNRDHVFRFDATEPTYKKKNIV